MIWHHAEVKVDLGYQNLNKAQEIGKKLMISDDCFDKSALSHVLWRDLLAAFVHFSCKNKQLEKKIA